MDDHDFQIVKTNGKNAPNLFKPKRGRETSSRASPPGARRSTEHHWFPTYTKVDDSLHFTMTMGAVHIRAVVKYENYRRFGSKARILYGDQEVKGTSEDQKNEEKADTQ